MRPLKNRILAISNHGAFLGGGEYSFFELLCRLSKTWEIASVVPENAELASKLRERGIDTRTIPLVSLRPRHAPMALLCLIAHTKLCAGYRPALVYANGSRAAFYGGIAGRLLRLPVLWHCRIADRDPLLDAFLCLLSSRIIVNSSATGARFRPGIRHKIRTVYNGLDLQWLRDPLVEKTPFIKDEWRTILAVSRISRDKRHDVILSSFERVARKHPSAHLICLGSRDPLDSSWWNELQERTHRSEAKERIHWLGHVEDVRPCYRRADVLVSASENESFGRVFVEAMALGVPVVATNVGGVPEVVKDGQDGILVPPGNSQDLTVAVLKILEDDDLRRRFSESGKERAEEFGLDAHVTRMNEVFTEAAGARDQI